MKDKVDIMEENRPKTGASIHLVYPLLTLLVILINITLGVVIPGRQFVSEPLHSVIEGLGCLAGMALAVTLLMRHRDDTELVFRFWVPAGLLSMSIMDGFHSYAPFGNSFVWLHSLAILLGGLLFAGSWLPFHPNRPYSRYIPTVFVVVVAILLGAISLFAPGILPAMLSGGSFNVTADVINAISGLLFMAAAAFFFSRYFATKNSQEILFACFSLLNGAAGLLFPFRQPWSPEWWSWHIWRLAGYLALLVYAFVILKRTTEENRIRKESYQSVIETSMDGFWIMDSRGHFLEVNDTYCRLSGYDREELLRMTIPEVEAAENPEDVYAHIRKVMEKGSDRFETRHRRKDGDMVDVEISIQYLPGGRLFAFVHDLTTRKKTQQQIIMNDRLASIGLLSAGIAHEVGNPLTIIAGYANTLPLMAELPDEVRDGLNIIEEQVQRAGDILGNLLVFARSDRVEKEPLSINESIGRVLKLRAHDRKVNNIELNTALDTDLPKVMGNRSKLEQVFYNIVTNAEFSMSKAHQHGNLTVTSEHTDNVVRITFADDGMGIPRDNLGRIFIPFFTTKNVGEGTGLGLSICQGIVAEHSGRLWAESTEGKGATFIIELPVYRDSN